MKEELENNIYRDLSSGKSIVSSLVELGVHSHRPFESMTDQVLKINAKFSNMVSDKKQLSEYLQQELTEAKRAYQQKIKSFM